MVIPASKAISCAGTSRRRHKTTGDQRNHGQRLGLTLLLFAVALTDRAGPAAAQFGTGLGTPGEGAAPAETAPTGGLGGAPSALPPPPSGAFGLPNPLAPPGTLPVGGAQIPTPLGPSGLTLPAPGAGITTLQAYDPTAPAVIIQPTVSLGETLYSNVNYTATNHQAASQTSLIPGVSISADTPRFTGVLSGNVQGSVYVPTSDLDQISANLYGTGTGTVLPNRAFVDVASYITEASTLPGVGFVNPSVLPRTQQSLVFTNTVSPYLLQSYDGLVDGELRYRFSSTNYGNNTGITSGTPSPQNSNLASSTQNEGTLILATGYNFQRLASQVIVDESSYNSNSTAQNTQFSAFNNFQYAIKPNIFLLGRAGYQNILYPSTTGASFSGATWLAGGQLGTASGRGYIALEYGRVQGVAGLNGSANYQITPTLTAQAYITEGLTSTGQSFQSALTGSTLGANGAIVNQTSGLPTQFFNPGVGLNNIPYRQHLYNFGLTEQLGRNSYSLFAYYTTAQELTTPAPQPTNSVGANLSWNRDIRPDTNGYASASYSRTTNAVTINTSTPVANTSVWTANIGLNHTFALALTGSVLYTFSYQPNGGTLVNGRPGDIVANTLQFYLTKAF